MHIPQITGKYVTSKFLSGNWKNYQIIINEMFTKLTFTTTNYFPWLFALVSSYLRTYQGHAGLEFNKREWNNIAR